MLSVPAFLEEHGISRSLLYRLIKEGRGPRLTKVNDRTLISAEAATEWRQRMERETNSTALTPRGSKATRAEGRREGE